METSLVILIIGLAAVAAMFVLLWRGQKRGSRMEAGITLADVFSMNVKLEPQDTAAVQEAVRAADTERGGEATAPGPSLGATTALARVLWVDDNPDYNVFETIALEKLGKLVTKTTSTAAALSYLSGMEFDVVITDASRAGDPSAGLDLVRRLRADGNELPIIVYTGNASVVRRPLLAAGASVVVDQPGPLIAAVEQRVRLGSPAGSDASAVGRSVPRGSASAEARGSAEPGRLAEPRSPAG